MPRHCARVRAPWSIADRPHGLQGRRPGCPPRGRHPRYRRRRHAALLLAVLGVAAPAKASANAVPTIAQARIVLAHEAPNLTIEDCHYDRRRVVCGGQMTVQLCLLAPERVCQPPETLTYVFAVFRRRQWLVVHELCNW